MRGGGGGGGKFSAHPSILKVSRYFAAPRREVIAMNDEKPTRRAFCAPVDMLKGRRICHELGRNLKTSE